MQNIPLTKVIQHRQEINKTLQRSQELYDALAFEPEPLTVLPYLATGYMETPQYFAAVILTLLKKSVSINVLIHSDILTGFLIVNDDDGHAVVTQAYKILSSIAATDNDSLPSLKPFLIEIAQWGTKIQPDITLMDGLEAIALNGKINHKIESSKRIDIKPHESSFSMTSTQNNFDRLYQYFGKTLLQQILLKNNYVDSELYFYITDILRKMSEADKKAFLHDNLSDDQQKRINNRLHEISAFDEIKEYLIAQPFPFTEKQYTQINQYWQNQLNQLKKIFGQREDIRVYPTNETQLTALCCCVLAERYPEQFELMSFLNQVFFHVQPIILLRQRMTDTIAYCLTRYSGLTATALKPPNLEQSVELTRLISIIFDQLFRFNHVTHLPNFLVEIIIASSSVLEKWLGIFSIEQIYNKIFEDSTAIYSQGRAVLTAIAIHKPETLSRLLRALKIDQLNNIKTNDILTILLLRGQHDYSPFSQIAEECPTGLIELFNALPGMTAQQFLHALMQPYSHRYSQTNAFIAIIARKNSAVLADLLNLLKIGQINGITLQEFSDALLKSENDAEPPLLAEVVIKNPDALQEIFSILKLGESDGLSVQDLFDVLQRGRFKGVTCLGYIVNENLQALDPLLSALKIGEPTGINVKIFSDFLMGGSSLADGHSSFVLRDFIKIKQILPILLRTLKIGEDNGISVSQLFDSLLKGQDHEFLNYLGWLIAYYPEILPTLFKALKVGELHGISVREILNILQLKNKFDVIFLKTLTELRDYGRSFSASLPQLFNALKLGEPHGITTMQILEALYRNKNYPLNLRILGSNVLNEILAQISQNDQNTLDFLKQLDFTCPITSHELSEVFHQRDESGTTLLNRINKHPENFKILSFVVSAMFHDILPVSVTWRSNILKNNILQCDEQYLTNEEKDRSISRDRLKALLEEDYPKHRNPSFFSDPPQAIKNLIILLADPLQKKSFTIFEIREAMHCHSIGSPYKSGTNYIAHQLMSIFQHPSTAPALNLANNHVAGINSHI